MNAGAGRRTPAAVVGALGTLGLLLAGCGAIVPDDDAAPGSDDDGRVACPLVEGQELPPECVPYDPEAAMAANDAYRERMELPEDVAEAMAAALEPARVVAIAALEPLADDPALDRETVRDALVAAGFDADALSISSPLYDPPVVNLVIDDAGCLVGEVGAGVVEIEVEGPINDGGCFPAQ